MLIDRIRASVNNRARSEGGSVSRRKLGFKSPVQRYNNLRAEGADGIVLTHAARGFESAEQHVAGRDIPLSAISIESTVEMV